MSYMPGFALDGKFDWRELEWELQERVLDELERIAANPPLPPATTFLSDFCWQTPHVKHYVWIRYVVDRTVQTITVIGIAHYLRQLSG